VIILGIDTATAATAVGLYVDTDGLEAVAEQRIHLPAPGEKPGHTNELLGLAADLLHEANLTWQAVDRIAVGVGPGTFTGLRIGVATARGLAQATGAQLAAVSTLESLWRNARESEHPVVACLDARRGEAFVAAWGAGGEQLVPEQAVTPGQLGQIAAGVRIAVGDGAIRFRSEIEAAGCLVPPGDDPRHQVCASVHCLIARHAPAVGRDDLVPNYVRAPDAVPHKVAS
jgi:tRNA threonylcarbamoyladenosine biosynthesis protein TsaB